MTDVSETEKFGSSGPAGNPESGKYEYSRGLGAAGQTVTTDGEEMVFSLEVSQTGSDERLEEDATVQGIKLVLATGRRKIGQLKIIFSCRVPLITEVRYRSTLKIKAERTFESSFYVFL